MTALWGCALLPAAASAESPRFYELEGFGRFLDGNPESTAITEDGAVALPPQAKERYADPAAAFSAATTMGEEVVAARVDDGEVIAIDRTGKTRVIHHAEEPLVTALLATGDGLLIAAGAPARIYKADSRGRVSLLFSPDAAYIWDMVEGPGGVVYCATGEPGTVVKLSADGKGKILFEPDQQHVRSLTYHAQLGLFVGGGERGVLYRSENEKDFYALLDTEHPEITAILVKPPYAFAAGVTGAAQLASEEGNEQQGKDRGKGSGASVRSQLIRVGMDGTAEVLAGSDDEALFAMAFDAQGHVVVATGATGRDDPRGRLYTVDAERRHISMTWQTPSRRITHLLPLADKGLAAVSAAGGRVTDIGVKVAAKGEFFSVPHDVGINARFGMLQVFGVVPPGTGATAAVRTGQTAKPDLSWSPWSKEIAAPGPEAPRVGNGRYLQVRLTLHSKGERSPAVHRVRLAYQRHNLPPFVREVVALRKGIALVPLPREDSKAKTISLLDKSTDALRQDKTERPSLRREPRVRQVEERGALTVKWIADDPNLDELRYDLMVRPSGSTQDWRTLGERLEDSFYTLKSTQLPDGHYQFRVRATDAPSNSDGAEKSDTRESRAVLIDNTPPRVDRPEVTVRGHSATVRTVVADAVGPLLEATYALDGADERPLSPDDGVLDGPGESFTIGLTNLQTGPHVLTIWVRDEADNEGFGEAHFSVR